MRAFISKYKIILVVVFFGLLLRVYGIDHGFPYIFHPDEPALVRGGLGIRFSINPGHFDWPHLYFYVNYLAFYGFAFLRDVFNNIGYKGIVSKLFPLIWNDKLIFYLLSRILTAMIGTAIIIPAYLSARELFDRKAGIFAALTTALIPLFVVYSHLALPDIPMVFFLFWYIYFSSKIFKNPGYKNYLLAGLFLGLSASTKYNGGLDVLYLLLIHFFTQRFNFLTFKKILSAGVFSILGLFIGTPFILFDFHTFIRNDGPQGALWQFTNVGSVPETQHFSTFISYFGTYRAQDFGYTVIYAFVFVLFLILFLFFKRLFYVFKLKGVKNELLAMPKEFQNSTYVKLLFLYIPTLVFIYYISGFYKNEGHYYLIIYPFVILAFSYFCSRIYLILNESKTLENILTRKIVTLVIMLILFSPLLLTSIIKINKLMDKKTGKAYGGEIEKYNQMIK